MPTRDLRERVTIPHGLLEALTLRLDNHALSAAIRLLHAQIQSYGDGVSTEVDLCAFAGVARKKRKAVEAQLKTVFDTSDGTWHSAEIAKKFAAETSKTEARRRQQGKPARAPSLASKAPTCAPQPDAEPRTVKPQPAAAQQADLLDRLTPETPTAAASADPVASPSLEADTENQDSARNDNRACVNSGTDTPPPAPQDTEPAHVPKAKPGTAANPQGSLALLDAAPRGRAQAAAPASAPNQTAVKSSTSLVKLVYDRGVDILMQCGQTQARARACLGMLLKDYDTAYVIKAIDIIEQRDGRVAEPFSYMRKLLQHYPRRQDESGISSAARRSDPKPANAARTPATERPRLIASPETMGLSDGLARRIRESAQYDAGYVFTEIEDDATAARQNNSGR